MVVLYYGLLFSFSRVLNIIIILLLPTICPLYSSMYVLFHFLSAAEYRSWLFFYSLPCLKGILSDELFNHYALLVGGIYLLCQESISPADLRKVQMLLTHFVKMFDVYYGVVSIQHLLTILQQQWKNYYIFIISRLLYLLHFCSLAPRYVLLNVHNLLHLVEDLNASAQWPIVVQLLVCIWRLEWRHNRFLPWNTECCQPGDFSLFFTRERHKEQPVDIFLFQYVCLAMVIWIQISVD